MSKLDEYTERQLQGVEGAAAYLHKRARRRLGPEWGAVLTALVFLNLALLLLVLQ